MKKKVISATVTPLLENGTAGEWNASESGHPYVFEDEDGKVYLFYQGSPDNGRNWFLSRTEVRFDEAGNPVAWPRRNLSPCAPPDP